MQYMYRFKLMQANIILFAYYDCASKYFPTWSMGSKFKIVNFAIFF